MNLPTVLIIDDEKDLGEILAEYLEENFDCTACLHPQDALSLMENNNYDLILSDVHIPGYDSIGFIEKVSEKKGQPPIVLFTGLHDEDPSVKNAISKGAVGVLSKPFGNIEHVVNYLHSKLKPQA